MSKIVCHKCGSDAPLIMVEMTRGKKQRMRLCAACIRAVIRLKP